MGSQPVTSVFENGGYSVFGFSGFAAPSYVFDASSGALSDTDALAARITWATMSVVERGHPLICALIAAEVTTAAEVDALFTSAATL